MSDKLKARLAIGGIAVSALLVGVGLYYSQIYAYYEKLGAEEIEPVRLVDTAGTAQLVAVKDASGIDSPSSPVRFRACFTMEMSADEIAASFAPYEGAEPLVAPDWFDCFNAAEIGKALEDGVAKAYLWHENYHYGIDRLVAVMPDGRAYAWQQINPCGKVVYDGKPAPEGCPEAPEL